MSMLTLYFLVKLDSLVSFMGWILFLSIVITAVFIIILCISMDSFDDEDGDHVRLIILVKRSIIALVFILFLYKAIPTTKEIAFIYIVGTITQAEQAKRIGEEAIKIPEKALQILNHHLDDYMSQFTVKEITN